MARGCMAVRPVRAVCYLLGLAVCYFLGLWSKPDLVQAGPIAEAGGGSAAGDLRVLTLNVWNTHNSENPHPLSRNPLAVRETALRQFLRSRCRDVDLLAFQECTPQSALGRIIAEELRETHEPIAAASLEARPRYSFARKARFAVRGSQDAPAKALAARVFDKVAMRELLFINVHLPWQGSKGELQRGHSPRRALLRELFQWAESQKPDGVVVTGDMNDPYHAPRVALEQGRALKYLAGLRDCWRDLGRLAPPTYPTFYDAKLAEWDFDDRAHITLDWVFLNGALGAARAAVLPEGFAGQGEVVSDHKAVEATLRWRAQGT